MHTGKKWLSEKDDQHGAHQGGPNIERREPKGKTIVGS